MTRVTGRALPGTLRDPLYPDSDSRPMGESDDHTIALIHLREALQDLFARRGVSDAYVATQLLMYYQQGNPSGRRDPDAMVALGAGSHNRRSWRVWEEGRLPDVLFEIASESTHREDLGAKLTLYEQLGIGEYFLFDPHYQYLPEPLMGFRLVGGAFQRITVNIAGTPDSTTLNVSFEPQGNLLRVIDMGTGEMVPTRGELAELAREQRERAEEAEEQLDQARQTIANLRAQLGLPPENP